MALDNSASHRSHTLIGQLKRKPSESCQKDVTLSCHKQIENFIQVTMVRSSAVATKLSEQVDLLANKTDE